MNKNNEMNQKIADLISTDAYGNSKSTSKNIPKNWVNVENLNLDLTKTKDWNIQRDAHGERQNQFKVFVNKDTQEIMIAIKGSDHKRNFVSDISNTGASEYKLLKPQLDAAFNAIKNDPQFAGYKTYTTGHSLGGGMGQTFAVENKLDTYYFNSLPISSTYIKEANLQEKIQDYAKTNIAIGLHNNLDIAKAAEGTALRGVHLDKNPSIINESKIEKAILNTPPFLPVRVAAGALEHTTGSIKDNSAGLAIDPQTKRYVQPEGMNSFAQIPPHVRERIMTHFLDAAVKVTDDSHYVNASHGSMSRTTFELSDKENKKITVYMHANGETSIHGIGKDGQHKILESSRDATKNYTLTTLNKDNTKTEQYIYSDNHELKSDNIINNSAEQVKHIIDAKGAEVLLGDAGDASDIKVDSSIAIQEQAKTIDAATSNEWIPTLYQMQGQQIARNEQSILQDIIETGASPQQAQSYFQEALADGRLNMIDAADANNLNVENKALNKDNVAKVADIAVDKIAYTETTKKNDLSIRQELSLQI
jgi:hypothetical protein